MILEDQKLFGLVLAGGRSSRMGKDKSAIVYKDKPQLQAAYEMLLPFCSKVFISSRKGQTFESISFQYPRIDDHENYQGKGPLSGILSAMKEFSDASWLVLACDLPFITEKTISYLVSNRHERELATAYRSRFDNLPEPLCAIWEKGYIQRIEGFFNKGIHCPRKILIQSKVHLLEMQTAHELDNVNNPDEFHKAELKIKDMTRGA